MFLTRLKPINESNVKIPRLKILRLNNIQKVNDYLAFLMCLERMRRKSCHSMISALRILNGMFTNFRFCLYICFNTILLF